jgi:hypothetical protein
VPRRLSTKKGPPGNSMCQAGPSTVKNRCVPSWENSRHTPATTAKIHGSSIMFADRVRSRFEASRPTLLTPPIGSNAFAMLLKACRVPKSRSAVAVSATAALSRQPQMSSTFYSQFQRAINLPAPTCKICIRPRGMPRTCRSEGSSSSPGTPVQRSRTRDPRPGTG